MPEGGNNGPAHAILDGLYELHETIGTGGFAKVCFLFLIIKINFKIFKCFFLIESAEILLIRDFD